MSYFAVRVDYEFDMDDGDRRYASQDWRAGVIEADDVEGACAKARDALKPEGGCWSAYGWEAVECADEDSATYIAREMERWDWGCSR